MLSAEDIIKRYQLEPLDQEGGFFRQIWLSPVRIQNSNLCSAYPNEGDHPIGTLIHFLITRDSFSAMHRLPTEEHWVYHLGDSCEMLLLNEDGSTKLHRIGSKLDQEESVYVITPKNSWQGTRLIEGGEYGYMFGSCVMIPGFDWTDFILGDLEKLTRDYPSRSEEIRARIRVEAIKGSP